MYAFKQALRGVSFKSGQPLKALNHVGMVFGMDSQSAAGRRAADAQMAQPFGRPPDAPDILAQLLHMR